VADGIDPYRADHQAADDVRLRREAHAPTVSPSRPIMWWLM
jgi:hypothetical protein